MDWFKLFDEAQTDPKLETLTDAQHRVWFKLLCLSNKQQERGVIPPMKPRVLAIEVAHSDIALLEETITALVDLDILQTLRDGTLSFIHWGQRQARKPSDLPEATAERKRRQRKRERGPEEDVTPFNKEVTPRHAMSRDREEEDKEEDSSLLVVDARAKEKNDPSPIRPIGKEPPPESDAGKQISLFDYLTKAAERLLDRALTRSHKNYLNSWFQGYKRELTRELIDYAESETAGHTDGESLAYMLRVIENQIKGTEKPRNGGKNGASKPDRLTRRQQANREGFKDAFGIPMDEAFGGGDEGEDQDNQTGNIRLLPGGRTRS